MAGQRRPRCSVYPTEFIPSPDPPRPIEPGEIIFYAANQSIDQTVSTGLGINVPAGQLLTAVGDAG